MQQTLPNEMYACLLKGPGMGNFCDYTGPTAGKLDAGELDPPKGASTEQIADWENEKNKCLKSYFRCFRPVLERSEGTEGAPDENSSPQEMISWLSQNGITIAPFSEHFQTPKIPLPPCGPNEVTAKVRAICLCFSDTKLINQGGGHARMYGRDLATDPTVPGHEACLEIIAVGETAEKKHDVHVGEMYTIQADIIYKGVGRAFGYWLNGAMEQFTVVTQETLDGDEGNYLIPVDKNKVPFPPDSPVPAKDKLSYAETALAEPWGCVSAEFVYRDSVKQGGTTWVIGATLDDLDEVKSLMEYKPARIIFSGDDSKKLQAALKNEAPQGIQVDAIDDYASVYNSTAQEESEGQTEKRGIDDIIVLAPNVKAIEEAGGCLARNGIMLLPALPSETIVPLDIGAVHYLHTSYIPHTEPTIAESYGKGRRDTLKAGGATWFMGAGGPMGQIWIQTALDNDDPPKFMLVTEIDDKRLKLLEEKFSKQAGDKNVAMVFANPTKEDVGQSIPDGGIDDLIVLCPVPGPVEAAAPHLADGAVVNVFAGIKIGSKANLDISRIYSNGLSLIGNSGSKITDLAAVIKKAYTGSLRPNTSVAMIAPITKAWEAMRKVMYRETDGKICIFPELDLGDLIPIEDLKGKFPSVHEMLEDAQWTQEAEEELFKVCPRL